MVKMAQSPDWSYLSWSNRSHSSNYYEKNQVERNTPSIFFAFLSSLDFFLLIWSNSRLRGFCRIFIWDFPEFQEKSFPSPFSKKVTLSEYIFAMKQVVRFFFKILDWKHFFCLDPLSRNAMNLQSTLYDHRKYHYANTTTQLKGGMNPIDSYDPSVIDLFPSVVAARSTALVCIAGFDLNSAL